VHTRALQYKGQLLSLGETKVCGVVGLLSLIHKVDEKAALRCTALREPWGPA
jgi:hypothetical protein